MLAAGVFTTTADTALEIIPANENREILMIQRHTGDECWLGIGITAVALTGIQLDDITVITLTGLMAKQAISAISNSAEACVGGYQEG